ncbi:hypothetical protein [Vagococcus humatus]|uniref:Uncharacterized protein n=1 Tax=Vagococcus humatus TaxID=1889241 RepID=A0A429Z694_9ENTE|nr:hypothetical protein [Vagococcus humatus]RST89213.1 hypothetical protein C7P63_05405 [Vagococcus humatus]
MSGSNNDPFQHYEGQSVIILDELRPNIIAYNELLKILDPHTFDVVVSSRYFNKPLTATTIIITTPYPPYLFFEKIKGLDKEIDKAFQLYRRLEKIIEVRKDILIEYEYDSSLDKFKQIDSETFKLNFTQEDTNSFCSLKELLN